MQGILLWIAMMVFVGGVTRLTGSGLSITEWAPILGAIPPTSSEAWDLSFKKYQETLQFKTLNATMTLGDFKVIYFWEYFHRLLARGLAIYFFLPWVWFVRKKVLSRTFAWKLLVGFLLGGMQGALGWIMVKSGLDGLPYVSHFRLAMHLSLALIIFGYFFLLFRSRFPRPSGPLTARPFSRKWIHFLGIWLALQIVWGAFVAGLKAGSMAPTFPKMLGSWIPESVHLWSVDPYLLNFFSSPILVHFLHRWSGVALWLTVLVATLRYPHITSKRLTWALTLQMFLGIVTVWSGVHWSLASLHQLWICVVIGVYLDCWLTSRKDELSIHHVDHATLRVAQNAGI
jgi:cytochrome c oxidase assembly protein subunit 15